MERIENLDFGAFRTQGTVDVDVIIHTSIVSFLAAGFLLTVTAGSPAAPDFSCPYECSRGCFVASSWSY
jgi:hypothetical protein